MTVLAHGHHWDQVWAAQMTKRTTIEMPSHGTGTKLRHPTGARACKLTAGNRQGQEKGWDQCVFEWLIQANLA